MNRLDLLEILRTRHGEWCAVEGLAQDLLAEPSAVEETATDLVRRGFRIDIDPRRGLRFRGTGDRLLPDEIKRDLGTDIIGHDVISLDKIESTNDAARRKFDEGASEGLAVFAEHQTRGRGRLGREWTSPPRSGLLMSVILTPGLKHERLSVLTTMAAVAVSEAIQEMASVPAMIRWPNDIMLRGRKLGGILVEGWANAGSPAFVLGIGLNINLAEEQFPAGLRPIATSLSIETGRTLDRIEIARGLLRSLDRWYGEMRAGHDALISQHWRQRSSTLGQRITIVENGQRYTGRALDISLQEGLILQLDRGITRVFDASRVTVAKDDN